MDCEKHYYAIKEVSEQTGVNSVTLRAWQRRYGLLNPERTEKGHRLYSEQDIERIRHILFWLEKGVAIGKVRPLLEGAASPKVSDDTQAQDRQIVESLITLLSECNGTKLQKQLLQIMKEYPLEVFIRQIVEPIENEIKRPENPLANIQQSLWQSVMMERCMALISQVRKGSAKPCYLLGFDKPASYRLWFEAWLLTERGYNVTVFPALEGKLAALEAALIRLNVSKLVIYGEQRITPTNLVQLKHLISKVECDYQFSGSISDIHPNLRPEL